MKSQLFLLATMASTAPTASAFVPSPMTPACSQSTAHSSTRPMTRSMTQSKSQSRSQSRSSQLFMVDDTKKAAPMVTGEELERMLQEWDMPLVVDAYATWCGPCLLMAPEFESAAQSLSGRVRFAKIDTDLEPEMATRLGIMGLPTLLFLDKNEDTEAVEEGKAPVAVLKERIEGALRKESIEALCEYHFFGGEMPTQLM